MHYGVRTPDPVWSESARTVSVTFLPVKSAVSEHKGSGKGSEKSSEKILAYLREHPMATIAEQAEVLGISARAVEKQQRRLRDSGQLLRIGPDKGGSWQVIGLPRPSSAPDSKASEPSDKNR